MEGNAPFPADAGTVFFFLLGPPGLFDLTTWWSEKP
jgi:hypothetical protein